jgi:surfeit locus 1 family protein
VSLGFWQLDRAEYKRNLYSDFENRQAAIAVDFDQDNINKLSKDELIWRHVTASGEFLEQYQILLDNQVVDTHAGYFVYTPLKLAHSDFVILVNRGWLLASADRKVVPEFKFTQGKISIKGVIKDIPKTGLLLKEMPPEKVNDSTFRVQRIDLEELSKLINLNLQSYILRLDPESDHGYTRKWRLPGSGESVHNGYAFQWFAFAAALIIIYLLLNFKKD